MITAIRMTEDDWDALVELSNEAGLPPERVRAVRDRFGPKGAPGPPTVLILGREETRFEEFLAPALPGGRSAASEGPRSLEPGRGLRRVYIWSIAPDLEDDVAERLDGADLMILVTRVSHPLTPREYELARALSTVAATIRVAYIVLPGEEVSSAELADLRRRTAVKLRQAGYHDGRALDAELWESSRAADRFESLLSLDGVDLRPSRAATARHALAALIRDGLRQVERMPARPAVDPSAADQWGRQFASYLEDLGGEVRQAVEGDRELTPDALVLAAERLLRTWPERDRRVGNWREVVETLWPRAWEQIGGWAVQAWKETLTVGRARAPATAPPPPAPVLEVSFPAMMRSLPLQAKRLAVGLATGLVAALLASLTPAAGNGVVLTMAALLGLILGLFAGVRFITNGGEALPGVPAVPRNLVEGWASSSDQIVARVRKRLGQDKTALVKQWEAFADLASIEEV